MAAAVDLDFMRALPKAELHAHLSGSISKECLHDIWRRNQDRGQCLELEDPLTAIRSGNDGFVDFVAFFPLFDSYIYALCNDIASVKYATERVLKEFSADGVRYLELRTTPRECVATGMGKEDYVKAVHDVILQWNQSERLKLEVFLILSVDRRMTLEEAMAVIDLAIQYQHNSADSRGCVVGVDLCGNPTKGDVTTFTPPFQKAKQHGLRVVAHFAEVPQSSSERELETILSWKPDRLGHCIHVPPKFRDIIIDRHIGLELCLSCNVLARLSTGGFENHHLKDWLKTGCPIALSTDDVGIFGSSLSNEYLLAARHFCLSKQQLLNLSRQAMDVAFAGRERMQRLLDDFGTDFKEPKSTS